MKIIRLLGIITILVLTLVLVPAYAFAQGTVSINDISPKQPGNDVIISGTATLGEVTIKVLRPNNTILYVDVVPVTSGSYAKTFKLPLDALTGNYTVVVGQGQVVQSTTFSVTGVTPVSNADLSNLTISSGSLSPTFSPGTTSYSVSVANSVSSVTVTPTKAHAGAIIMVNGTVVSSGTSSGAISLSVGANNISMVVTAEDGITTKTYTITVQRASAPSGGFYGPATPAPAPAPGNAVTVIGGTSVSKQVTTTTDGQVVETYTVQAGAATQIGQAKTAGSTTVEIQVDITPAAIGVINVPSSVLQSAAGMNVVITTPNAKLELPAALVDALAKAGQDLSITVKRGDAATVTPPDNATVVGVPTVINTDIKGSTNITLPLTGISMPADPEARAAFLADLAVFVIHSDGEKKVVTGTIVYDAAGNPTGITFTVDKFSTFAIIKVDTKAKKVINLTIGDVKATVDGKPYTLDVEPFVNTKVNRTLVPLRFISETLGAKVDWKAETRQIVIRDSGVEIVLTIGSDRVLVNGIQKTLDCPAELSVSRTFVPLRFASETLGARVDYDAAAKQITITR